MQKKMCAIQSFTTFLLDYVKKNKCSMSEIVYIKLSVFVIFVKDVLLSSVNTAFSNYSYNCIFLCFNNVLIR